MFEAPTTTPTITDGEVVAWFETVLPERAKQMLSTYEVDYRKLRPSYASGLARDMANGKWNFDGAPIRIDSDGNLFDGQHRLNAVIESGKAQTFLILGNLPVEAYNTADTGLARTYGDTLRRRGYNNVSLRGALQKIICRWETGKSLDDTKRLTYSELDEIMFTHIDTINHAIANTTSTVRKTPLPGTLMAFSWWVLAKIDVADAKTFLVSLAEGENLRRKQPVYTLRERLRNDAERGHTRNEYMHLVFAAWNAFREGRELSFIPLPSGFVSREMIAMPK